MSHQQIVEDHAPETEQQPEATEAEAELASLREEAEMWRDRALRLQAEIENFRKRQRQLAEEHIAEERERLLRSFLDVGDNLQRALRIEPVDIASLRQGVELTLEEFEHVLSQEEVEPVEALGQPFDPAWHEALDTVPVQEVAGRLAEVEPGMVVEVVREGYRLGDQLLRPARVIVAR